VLLLQNNFKSLKKMGIKEKQTAVKQQSEDLFKLILKKTNTNYNEFISMMKEMYVAANIGVVTSTEKKQFPQLTF